MGTLAPDADSGWATQEVVLRPRASYRGAAPDPSAEAELHQRAHALCYLAQSVRCTVRHELVAVHVG